MHIGKRIERAVSRVKQFFILRRLVESVGLRNVVEEYKGRSFTQESIGEDSNIWIMWYQGEENMPEIVRMCYNSIKMNAGSHPVVLITKDNLKEYVTLPDFIEEKIAAGIIDFTHASDIIRSYLLKTHGGIWIDITNLINDVKISDFVPSNLKFWSVRGKTHRNNVTRGWWTSYFQAAGKGCIIQSFIYDAHIFYWSKRDKLIVYLLLDYIFWIGFKHLPEFKSCVMEVPSSRQGELMKSINKEYSEELFNKIVSGTNFSKLSYKRHTTLTTKEGKPTIYSHLREKYL